MRLRLALALCLVAVTACTSPPSEEDDSAVAGEDALVSGKLDAAFGNAGVVTLDGFPDTQLESIVEQKNGALLIAGRVYGADRKVAGLRVLRLGTDGKLDPSFGTGGVTVLPPGLGAYYGRVELEAMADDRILVVGSDFVLRLTAAGAPDVSFGSGGKVDIAKAVSFPDFAAWTIRQARASDDAVLLSIWGRGGAGGWSKTAIVRLDAHGVLDTGYGAGGLARLAQSSNGDSSEFLVDAQGRVLVSSEGIERAPISATSRTTTPVLRLDARGRPDETFGPKGVIWIETGRQWPDLDLKAVSGGVVYGEAPGFGRVGFRLDGTVVSPPRHAAMAPPRAIEWQADGKRLGATRFGRDAALVTRGLQDGSGSDRSFAQHGEAFVRFPTAIGEVERVRTVRKGTRVVVLAGQGYVEPRVAYVARFQ